MSEYIDLRYVAEDQPSLCIPRAFNNVSEAQVRRTIEDLRLGSVSSVDILEKENEKGEKFKRIFVHFNKWFWNKDAQLTRKKLIAGKEIKIVYDNPWFWKISASRYTKKPVAKPKPTPKPTHDEYVVKVKDTVLQPSNECDIDNPPSDIFVPDYQSEAVVKMVKRHKKMMEPLEDGEILEDLDCRFVDLSVN